MQFYCNIRPTKHFFLNIYIKTGSLGDFTVPSPPRVSQPNLAAGMQPTESSPSLCYVSSDQLTDGRIKPQQTMRWLQLYVSTGFSMVILCYVSCHMFFVFCMLQQWFLPPPLFILSTLLTLEIRETYNFLQWSTCKTDCLKIVFRFCFDFMKMDMNIFTELFSGNTDYCSQRFHKWSKTHKNTLPCLLIRLTRLLS